MDMMFYKASYWSVFSSIRARLLGLAVILTAGVATPAFAQDTQVIEGDAAEKVVDSTKGLNGSLIARPNARTTTLSIPAPRGQITDRYGKPFAQTKVVWYPALQYAHFEKADKEYVVKWARKRIDHANQVFGMQWNVSDDALWDHYRNRRWMPMPVTRVVSQSMKSKMEKQLIDGLIMHPVYIRHYPQGRCAAHIIGYVGSQGKLEKGPMNHGDPLFERAEGRSGLEKIYNENLTGREGLLRQDYNGEGGLVLKKYEGRPKPGGTIVTTLDLEWQKHAEKVLQSHCERGAFVVIDIHNGDVLAMASRPGFNLNDFIPFITTEKYGKLRDNPGKPLFARAFQGAYPPASTFKPVVAVTALTNKDIYAKQLIDCPAKIKIGNHWFNNWSKIPEGHIGVKRAMARSCNPWFYKVGIKAGPTAFLSVAKRLGFGSKTGLPLVAETSGLIPNNEWMKKHHGRRLTDGDTANLAIGQGVMLASPLQVAQAMAGIGSGGALPQLRLVKQVQNVSGRVLVANDPDRRNFLNLDPEAVDLVRRGMKDVVHADYGTGKKGSLSFTILCGKTGTAQWGPSGLNQGLAWFSGFFPYDNPRYAFAALYEGKPHEPVSGGRKAAPMVRAFFENFKTQIKSQTKPAPAAVIIEEEYTQLDSLDDGSVSDLIAEEDAPAAVIVPEDGDDTQNSTPDTSDEYNFGAPENNIIPEKSEEYYEGFLKTEPTGDLSSEDTTGNGAIGNTPAPSNDPLLRNDAVDSLEDRAPRALIIEE